MGLNSTKSCRTSPPEPLAYALADTLSLHSLIGSPALPLRCKDYDCFQGSLV